MNYTNENLNQSPVHFDELAHTYTTAEGKQLSGITWIIEKYITPDKYAGTPERVLDAAAERGHLIHSQVQMICEGFPIAAPAPEVSDFFDKMIGTEFIAAEYLVGLWPKPFSWVYTDKKTGKKIRFYGFCSAIDIIDGELNIYDIKTTDKLDIEYLRWQLSIYAYLFEKQNPTLKVNELRAVWLRDAKCKRIVKVERIADELVADLLYSAADGLEWSNPFVNYDAIELHSKDLAKVAKLESTIAELETTLKKAKADKEALIDGLKPLFKANNVKTFDTGSVRFTYVPESEAEVIDTARLKAERPDVAAEYTKRQKRKDSMRITIKEC